MSKLQQLCPDQDVDINGVKVTIMPLPAKAVPEFADSITAIIDAFSSDDVPNAIRAAYDQIMPFLVRCVCLKEDDGSVILADEFGLPVIPKLLRPVIEKSLGLGEWQALGAELRAAAGIVPATSQS